MAYIPCLEGSMCQYAPQTWQAFKALTIGPLAAGPIGLTHGHAMLCYAMLCYAMLCCAVLCYASLLNAMLRHVMLHYAMSCYAML